MVQILPALTPSSDTALYPILDRYIEGITWLSKSDVHMELHGHAFGVFYEALRRAIEVLDQSPDGRPEAMPEHVAAVMRRLHPRLEEVDKYVAAGEAFVHSRVTPAGKFTLEEAAIMKTTCDLFLLRHLLKMPQLDSGDTESPE